MAQDRRPPREATPPTPSLSAHYEQLAVDRLQRDGMALAAALAIGPGDHVLDLACATGMLAEHLADRVGPRGEVLGLDVLPLRVQIAHQRSRHNLRFQVGGPDQLGRFRPGSFDVIVAHEALHRWPDAAATLAECARLLRPGGRLGLSTVSAGHPAPAQLALQCVLAQPAYACYPWPDAAREHRVSAETLDGLLRCAGFGPVQLRRLPELAVHATADGAIEAMQATAWGPFLGHLPPELRGPARAEVVRHLEARRGPEGIRHEGLRLVALACLPPAGAEPRRWPGAALS